MKVKEHIDYLLDHSDQEPDDMKRDRELSKELKDAAMILNVGYLKLNEKTSIPIFGIIENIIEEVDNITIRLLLKMAGQSYHLL